MRISVVTPTRDRPEVVKLCRRWFKEQTYPIHEHVFAEGGGILENLVRGIKAVDPQTDVVLMADDDDYYAPGWSAWIADAFSSPLVRAGGQLLTGITHVRAEARLRCLCGPLPGMTAFRITERDEVLRRIAIDGTPKKMVKQLAPPELTTTKRQFCYALKGLYHGAGGDPQMHEFTPALYPIPDPGLHHLRAQIGDDAVDAYMRAIDSIDMRRAG